MEKDQKKIINLEKELIFYKGIVAPKKIKQSIYLQSFELVPFSDKQEQSDDKGRDSNKEKRYKYKFVVAQKARKRTKAKGSIRINIKGKQADKTVELSMNSLIQSDDKKQKKFQFSFKYFIEFEGIISMADNIIPSAIDIIIKTTKNQSTIELNDLSWTEQGGFKYVE